MSETKTGTMTIEIMPDISKFTAGMKRAVLAAEKMGRSVNRHFAQIRRNQATGPLSDERREIQAIGRREMAEAVDWFRARIGATDGT